ncbi:hypothetical protein DB346_24430 [Verrucomicrobia bacterium LW23]|nr:hypothetical protein DB346_24430 [Verrucomicrobia bacterium LW23]
MALKNDGSLNYGSMVLEFTGPAGTASYVADNVKINRPTFKIESRDHLNRPDGKVVDDDFVTGTATLKWGNARAPQNGDETTIELDSAIGEEVFYITNVGLQLEKAGLKMVEVAIDKKYNT